MTHFDIISNMAAQPLILRLKSCIVEYFSMCMSCENGVKNVVFICISNPMSCAGNNYKLLLNDQNEFGVVDMIERKMKYTVLLYNVHIRK